MIRVIEDGLYQPAMKERMTALETEKMHLMAGLSSQPSATPDALDPNLPQIYRRKVVELEAVLTDPELGPEAMAAIRAMIARIVLTPAAESGMAAMLEGDLARILICAGAERTNARRVNGGRSMTFRNVKYRWSRGQDLNLRPSGYEFDESPGADDASVCASAFYTSGGDRAEAVLRTRVRLRR